MAAEIFTAHLVHLWPLKIEEIEALFEHHCANLQMLAAFIAPFTSEE
jgi:hypothetical protein